MLANKEVIPKFVDSGELCRYSPGRVELSSKDRDWKNLLVTRFVYDTHYLASSPWPATPDHSIVMLDAGSMKGWFSYNQGHYRPCEFAKGDWIIGQAFENHLDAFGDILRENGQEFATLVIHLSPKLLALVADDLTGIDSNKIELRHQINVRDPLMAQIANVLKLQIYQGDLYGKMYAETAAHLLAVHLLQNYCTCSLRFPKIKGRLGNRIEKVLDYVQDNLHTEISIDSLADVAHMSPYYFIKWFKKQLGETPYQFTTLRRRMEKAKHLLKCTEKPLIDIASEIGYGYACNFSNAFKQHTGMTPNGYRKNC
ncbi:MAG: AraC family transcriptional regulator [Candidatus Thiodiazotropha sp. (ex Lucinoma kastoroae)]|nr:AraC family transcriptional regulator [Candidatus Thiodiazotropha sp. (ex Lucinoma kastoroae)]